MDDLREDPIKVAKDVIDQGSRGLKFASEAESRIVSILKAYHACQQDYGRLRQEVEELETQTEAFGVLWDRNCNMRCLSCKKPLKHSTLGSSIFYCSDPECNSKYVLRNDEGIEITRQDAIIHLKQRK